MAIKMLSLINVTLLESLNVDWDTHAVVLPPDNMKPTYQHNPIMEHSYPQLQISNQISIQHLQHQFHNTATHAAYLSYLQEKFQ